LLALLTLLTDTGVRINEALTLTRGAVDFENLLIDVKGKGSKVRRIPFSLECRKVLFKHSRSHSHELVFCNRDSAKIRYDNLRRDFRRLISNSESKDLTARFTLFEGTL
jgi:site-specific recombinase XerD